MPIPSVLYMKTKALLWHFSRRENVSTLAARKAIVCPRETLHSVRAAALWAAVIETIFCVGENLFPKLT